MTRQTRLTVPLLVFLAVAVAGAVPLVQASIIFTLLALAGAFGAGGLAATMLLAPRSSRIRRPEARASPAPLTAGRARTGSRRSEGARAPSSGAQGGKKKSRGRGRSNEGPKVAGTVKWFSDKKGFGFITPENGDEDCFVHRSAVQGNGSLNEGSRVEFQIISDDKGRRAAANVVSL